MSILELCQKMGDLAAENPRGMDAEVVIWLRSRKEIPLLSILELTHVEPGFRQSCGGPVVCLCATLGEEEVGHD
jgi:hypothetical protein